MISTLTCPFLHISKWKKEKTAVSEGGGGGNEKIKRKKNSLSKRETKMEVLVCQLPLETKDSCSLQNVLPKSTPTSHYFSDVQRDFMAVLTINTPVSSYYMLPTFAHQRKQSQTC